MQQEAELPSRNKGGVILTILAVFALIIVLFFVAAYFYPEVFVPFALNRMRQDHPSLSLTPQPMDPVPAAPVQPELLTSYGYEFQTPWGKPQSVQSSKDFNAYNFADNIQMYSYDPEKAFDFLGSAIIVSSVPDEGRRVFGRSDIDSYFEAMRAILETVPPPRVSLFVDRKQAIAIFGVLNSKSVVVQDTAAEVLAFELGEWHGFQINEPKANAKSTVFLFVGKYTGFKFSFSRIGENQIKFMPQAEINAVLLSIRPANPEEEPRKTKGK